MKILKIILAAFILFVLERLIFTRFPVFSITPWLGFAFCMIGAAVSADNYTAIITAAIYGLISDLTGGGTAGTAMFVFGISAAIIQLFACRIFKNSIVVSVVSVFIVGLIGEMLYYLLNLKGIDISGARLFISIALPLAVLNTAFALIFYPISKWIFAERRVV